MGILMHAQSGQGSLLPTGLSSALQAAVEYRKLTAGRLREPGIGCVGINDNDRLPDHPIPVCKCWAASTLHCPARIA